MTVNFELPNNLETSLRREFADLNQLAKESALVELYRREKITRCELSEALGLGRIETDEVLKNHNVTEDLGTVQAYNATLDSLREKIGV